MKFLRVTEVLAMAGVTDYSWVTEEAKYRGSEVHRAVKLANDGTLKRKSVPQKIGGYFSAFEKFKRECSFVPSATEKELESEELGLRGRMDAKGAIRGQRVIVDFKSTDSGIREATGLQLVLYGYMDNPNLWSDRVGVQLRSDGTYRLKTWPRAQWQSDLVTARACIRVAQWRLANGLVKA